jgi:hypothetical protein
MLPIGVETKVSAIQDELCIHDPGKDFTVAIGSDHFWITSMYVNRHAFE